MRSNFLFIKRNGLTQKQKRHFLLLEMFIPYFSVKKGDGKECDLKRVFLLKMHLCSKLKVKNSAKPKQAQKRGKL
jgi:hypothetical protein